MKNKILLLILYIFPIFSDYDSIYEVKKEFAFRRHMERFHIKNKPIFEDILPCCDVRGTIFIVSSDEGVSFIKITENYNQLVGLLTKENDVYKIIYPSLEMGFRYRWKNKKLIRKKIHEKKVYYKKGEDN